MKVFKVEVSGSTGRKGVVSNNYEEFIAKCVDKFGLVIPGGSTVKVVLKSDGTEVDSEYFGHLPNDIELMVLGEGELWPVQATCSGVTKTESDSRDVGEVMKIVEGLRKRKHMPQTNVFKIALGWMHWSYKDRKYKQVRSNKGEKSKTENLSFGPMSYDEVMSKAIQTFFPKGKSKKGRKEAMTFSLGNVKGLELRKEGFSLKDYVKQCTTQKCRIYLLSKAVTLTVDELASSNSSGTSDELPDIQPPKRRRSETPGHPNTPPMAANPSYELALLFRVANTPTVNFRLPSDNAVCPICYDRQKDTCLFPCGHPLCANQLFQNTKICPMCRETIMKISCVNV